MTDLSETLPELAPSGDEAGTPLSTTAPSPADASLLALVDRLAGLLERSDLVELEVEAGSTGLILRKPGALAASPSSAVEEIAASVATPPVPDAGRTADLAPAEPEIAPSRARTVLAPLTGIFYTSPSPGSPTYVTPGAEVVAGQVIGLIEAMKLFNEIKSDQAGRVVRYVAEHGALVKAKQPLLEVEPL